YFSFELRLEIGAGGDRQNQDWHDRGRNEGQEQLAIKARADLAEQRPPARRLAPGQQVEQRGSGEQHDVEHGNQKNQLGDVDEVPAPGDHRIAEGVDPTAIAHEVDAEIDAIALDRGPERYTRLDHLLEHGVAERPDARAGAEARRTAPSVRRELNV